MWNTSSETKWAKWRDSLKSTGWNKVRRRAESYTSAGKIKHTNNMNNVRYSSSTGKDVEITMSPNQLWISSIMLFWSRRKWLGSICLAPCLVLVKPQLKDCRLSDTSFEKEYMQIQGKGNKQGKRFRRHDIRQKWLDLKGKGWGLNVVKVYYCKIIVGQIHLKGLKIYFFEVFKDGLEKYP